MVEITKTVYLDSREKWRRWLEKNHDRVDEIWLLYAKKGSGKKRVAYADAVEEALCFGWIDGVVKPVDENYYAQRFTPRRAGSRWSTLNRQRYARLLRDGKIAPPGLAKKPDHSKREREPRDVGDRIPAYIRTAFRDVSKKFRELPAGQRRLIVFWIDSAKKAETREKRIREAIERLENDTIRQWLRGK